MVQLNSSVYTFLSHVKYVHCAETYFMMADLHAITVPHEPKELLTSTRNTAALYLACGIDPDRAAVFVQSHVTAHAELAWMLQCYTPIGWLRKMTQFKTKSEKQVRLWPLFWSRVNREMWA